MNLLINLASRAIQKLARERYGVYLEGVVEPIHRRRVHGADHLEDAVKVIELLKDLQDLDDAGHHGYALLQVLRLHDTPEQSATLAANITFKREKKRNKGSWNFF